MSARFKVAFAHFKDIHDAHTWSGTPRALLHALQRQGVDVLSISPLERISDPHDHEQFARYAAWGQHYHFDSTRAAVEGYARQVERAVRTLRPDLLLSVNPLTIADIDVNVPVVMWTDATYALLHQTYPSFSDVSAESIVRGWQVDAAALERCDLALYSSAWAAHSARQDFGMPRDRLEVLRYGANLDRPPGTAQALEMPGRRDRTTLRLLWVGVDWHRKGGDIAIETLRALRRAGVPATLTMVGILPPEEDRHEPGVHVEGFVSKNSPAGRARLDALLAEAHVLLLPSRADCTPMVVGEAGAFAVPVLASNVGGMSDVVCDGVNGLVLAPESTGEVYAARLAQLWEEPERYAALAHGARRMFDEVLNWDTATRAFLSRVTALPHGASHLLQAL